jgi:hypothetical protein
MKKYLALIGVPMDAMVLVAPWRVLDKGAGLAENQGGTLPLTEDCVFFGSAYFPNLEYAYEHDTGPIVVLVVHEGKTFSTCLDPITQTVQVTL